jgi:hypothetical protein
MRLAMSWLILMLKPGVAALARALLMLTQWHGVGVPGHRVGTPAGGPFGAGAVPRGPLDVYFRRSKPNVNFRRPTLILDDQ